MSEIADLTVKEQLQTISDVSSVSIWGEKNIPCVCGSTPSKWPATVSRLWTSKMQWTMKMSNCHRVDIEGNTIELNIRTMGLMNTAKMFDDLIVKHEGNQIIRFSDIGRAELGPPTSKVT